MNASGANRSNLYTFSKRAS